MHRFTMLACLALMGLAVAAVAPANAQYVYYSSPIVAPAPVVSYSYYAPPPTTVYYSAPAVSYYAPPAVSYYTPAVSYYTPAVSYYAPSVSYYAAPAAVYPGTVTTRSYVGLGIFRPRGVYTQSYYTPGYVSSYYAPSYYAPVIFR